MIRLLHYAIVGLLALTFPTAGPTATDPAAAPPERELVAAVEAAWVDAGLPPPVYDPRISRAAARLLERAEGQDAKSLPDHWSGTVRFELLREEVRDTEVLPLVLEAGDLSGLGSRARWILGSDLCPEGLNRYGFALDEGEGVVRLSLVLVRHLVDLGPLPMEPAPGHSQLFWGTLAPGLVDPRVLLSTPGGGLVEQVPSQGGDLFWTRLYFPEEGIYTVEVMITGPRGPETAALFEVYSGVPRPQLPTVRLCATDAGRRSGDPEEAILSMVNRERIRRALPPLAVDERLRRCARGHSEAMASMRRLAHLLPGASRADCPAVRQNIAMARSLCGAHQQLMESPSHRRNILDRDIRSCGVGVSTVEVMPGVKLFYVTQEFPGGHAAAEVAP
ncbi:MAG: CAP domain-containing protein [Deltaproteobacteria bacterium]|nr:CAP domain-containing protein [Deltaproteobacteria bacterium]